MSSRAVVWRLGALLALLVVLLAIAGAVGLHRMRDVTLAIDSVFRDRVVPMDQLRSIQDGYGLRLANALAQPAPQALAELDRLAERKRSLWSAYLQTTLTDHEKRLVAHAEPALLKADDALVQARTLLQRGDAAALRRFVEQELLAELAPAAHALDALMALQVEVAGQQARASRNAYDGAAWMLLAVGGVGLAGGGLLAYAVAAVWLRERGRAESATRLQATMFQTLSRTNRALVHAANPDELLQQVARICSQTGLIHTAALFLRDSGRSFVRVAVEGAGANYYEDKARFDLDDPAAASTAAGQVLVSGRRVVWQDYQKSSAAQQWRDDARRVGIGGVAAFPIRRGGEVVGVMAIQSDRIDFFTPELVELFDEMVSDLTFALDHLDRERAAADSLRHFQLLFHRSPVPTVITRRADRVIVEANDSFCRRYGMERARMLGHTMPELGVGIVAEDSARVLGLLQREGRLVNAECRVRVADGAIRHTLLTADHLPYQGEDCFIFIGLDVTDRHQAEAARQEALAAELANRAKTDFLSRMSHELRTPLNAVLGFSQLLQADEQAHLSARQLTQVGHIHKAGWHLLELINDVLDVARIEAGKLQVVEQTVDLAEALAEAVRLSEPLAGQHGVALRFMAEHGAAPGALADPMRLRQVLLNLLSNGIKYNRPGGSVRVELSREGPLVHVDVIDSGIGMTREQLDHLYEPFNRLGRERGGIEGTGIGLAITLQLVQLMGGQLNVSSEAGSGTHVRVSLRAVDAAAAAGALRPSGPSALDSDDVTGVVLYIEDNPVNSILVEQLLARWPGVRVLTSPDGASGIADALRWRPDLVLLDMQLPDMGGVQVLDALRADPRTAGLRVVALSASAMPDEVEAARRAGAGDYWTKPLDFEAFLRQVRRLLAATVG